MQQQQQKSNIHNNCWCDGIFGWLAGWLDGWLAGEVKWMTERVFLFKPLSPVG